MIKKHFNPKKIYMKNGSVKCVFKVIVRHRIINTVTIYTIYIPIIK